MTRFDVLVLFGSTSDASVYEPLCALLREQGWRVDFEVISKPIAILIDWKSDWEKLTLTV